MIRSSQQDRAFDASLRLGVEAYKDCWSNIYSCLGRGQDYISLEDLQLLYSAAEVCESSLFYLIYNPRQFNQAAVITSLACLNTARFCQKYSGQEMEKCARSLQEYGQLCIGFAKPQEI